MSWFKTQKQGDLLQISVELPVSFIEEGNSVIAYTPALDLSTCGKSRKEAHEMFQEIVKIFFNDLVENNTADEVLGKLGWKKDEVKSSWIPQPRIAAYQI
ncbi:MAG TPA: hypothetical protein VMU27_01410 [Candidatus Paceibacterota bacterium]|nr:hypothetical protein [Candidatus Paceibacterota bacterium]